MIGLAAALVIGLAAALAILAGCGKAQPHHATTPSDTRVAGPPPPISPPGPQWRADSARDGRVTRAGRTDIVYVRTPGAGESVTSPLVVRGVARASWYAAGAFPVRLEDESGHLLGLAIAHAVSQGDATHATGRVPFEAVLGFGPPAARRGFVVLLSANAAGEPSRADTLRVAVHFDSPRP